MKLVLLMSRGWAMHTFSHTLQKRLFYKAFADDNLGLLKTIMKELDSHRLTHVHKARPVVSRAAYDM